MDKRDVRPRPHRDSTGACRFDLRRRCTRSDSAPVCQLLWRLEACNQLLSHIGFQLREEEEDGIGELRLVLTPRQVTVHPWRAPMRFGTRSRAATDLFRRLCEAHRCVTLVELDYDVARYEVLLAAIKESVGVKRLRVYDFHDIPRDNPGLFDVILELVTSMERVDELEFRKRHHHSIDSVPLPPFSLSRVGGTTLRKLNVADLNLRDSEVSKLITLLMCNDTVTELAVGTSVCTFAGTETSLGFADYLAKAKGILRSLTLRSVGFCSAPDLERLVNTIAAMTALEELVVDMVPCGSEGTDIFAEVLAWSTTLRHLSVVLPPWWDRSMFYDVFDEPDNRFRSVRRWLTGLAKTTVLETLTLDLLGFHLDECRMLFRALAENASVRRVTVHRLIEWGCVESACRMIRECGLSDRVLIKDHNMSPNSMSKLPACPEVKAVTVYSHWFRAASCNIRAAFRVLGACGHLTSLRVHLSDHTFNYSVLNALASYLAGPNQLREVEVHFYASLFNELNMPHDSSESPLIKAVSSKPNLSKLTLRQLRLSDADCRLLADSVRRSPNLRDLTLSAANSGHFLRLFAPSAARNYTLLNICLSNTDGSDEDMKVVVDVARRNRSLVARAARFVLDDDRSIYCASAIELVSRHPKLAETLQDKAAVGESGAKEMIRRALNSISGLDAYMTAVRVVKDRVECCSLPDAGVQLDQLNHDCWLHIRQYLKVADVLQAGHPL
ncbi:uncharacterized protein LOC142589705 [Dermacentor variabilis]|uniref:uncharacterized protein LOC142589705 n=1 Tax=Dermacentor variabilis TaxID=34621 RepID=UPI003F5CB2A9